MTLAVPSSVKNNDLPAIPQMANPSQAKAPSTTSSVDSISKAESTEKLEKKLVLDLPTTTSATTLSIDEHLPTIPLIDLEAISVSQGNTRKALIKRFGDGLKDVGFIAVKAEALTSLIGKVNSEMADYFHQSLDQKMKDWHNNNAQTGFSPQGSETAAGAKKADIKETYFIPPNFENWPKDRPGFKDAMKQYHQSLTTIAAQVMTYFAEYLGEKTEDIAKSMSAAHNLLRLAYYPAPKVTDDPSAVWAAAHEDLNGFTLLPPSTVPGLQLLTKENEWKPVTVPPGYLIVNTGEQLQCKTAGLIKATRHRVLNPGKEYSYTERFASIFFASWSSEFRLKPFEKCVQEMTKTMTETEKEVYLKQFPDVTVQENLLSRLIEMGTIKEPDEGLVLGLRGKGLLQKPTEALSRKYPAIFREEGKAN